jgi:hypothetical protein
MFGADSSRDTDKTCKSPDEQLAGHSMAWRKKTQKWGLATFLKESEQLMPSSDTHFCARLFQI